MFGIIIIFLILFVVLYERISTYTSAVASRNYYKTHELLNSTSKIESKNYIIKKISDYRGYSGNIKDIVFYDNDREEFVWEFYEASEQIIISKNSLHHNPLHSTPEVLLARLHRLYIFLVVTFSLSSLIMIRETKFVKISILIALILFSIFIVDFIFLGNSMPLRTSQFLLYLNCSWTFCSVTLLA